MDNNWSREWSTNSGYVGSPRRHRTLSCIALGRAQRFWRVAKLRNVWHDSWTCHSESISGTCELCSTRNLERREGKCSKRLPHSQDALLEMVTIRAIVSRICFRSNWASYKHLCMRCHCRVFRDVASSACWQTISGVCEPCSISNWWRGITRTEEPIIRPLITKYQSLQLLLYLFCLL